MQRRCEIRRLSKRNATHYDPGEQCDRSENPLHELEEPHKQVCVESIEAARSTSADDDHIA